MDARLLQASLIKLCSCLTFTCNFIQDSFILPDEALVCHRRDRANPSHEFQNVNLVSGHLIYPLRD